MRRSQKHIDDAHLINEHLKVFYDREPKPSEYFKNMTLGMLIGARGMS